MWSHVSLGTRELARAAAVYDAVLAPLGHVRVWSNAQAVGYGPPGGADGLALFFQPGDSGPLAAGPGAHLALVAPSRDAVDRFHAAALVHGGADVGAPGLRPRYGAGYYAAFVLDLDGHKLEAVSQ